MITWYAIGTAVRGETVTLVLGGWRDASVFVDFSGARRLRVPMATLGFTAARTVGVTLVDHHPSVFNACGRRRDVTSPK